MWLQAWIFENVIEFDADWNQIYLPSTASMLPNLTIQLKKFIIKLTKVAKYERSGATSCYMAIGEKSAVVTQTRRKAYWLRVTQFPPAMFHRCSLKAGTNFSKWLWIRLWLRDGAAFKMMGENIGTIFNTFSEKNQQITVCDSDENLPFIYHIHLVANIEYSMRTDALQIAICRERKVRCDRLSNRWIFN